MRAFKDLWAEATMYGRPTLYMNSDNLCCCYVEFNTIRGVNLKATVHGFKTPEEALDAVIQKCQEIVNSVSKLKELPPKN